MKRSAYENSFRRIEFTIYATALVAVLNADVADKTSATLALIFMLLLTRLTSAAAAARTLPRFLNLTFRHYLLLAAPTKCLTILLAPESTIGALTTFDTGTYPTALADALQTFAAGTIGIEAAICAAAFAMQRSPTKLSSLTHAIRTPAQETAKYPAVLTAIALTSLAIKLLLIDHFSMAQPGIAPKQLPLPFLTGALNTFAIHGVFFTSLFILLHSAHTPRLLRTTSAFCALLNAAIDFTNGYKFSIVSGIIVAAIYLSSRKRPHQPHKLPLSITQRVLLFSLMGAAGAAYPMLDLYSDLRGAGLQVSPAIIIDRLTDVAGWQLYTLPITEIIRRVNGVDTYIIAHYFIHDSQQWHSLFDASAVTSMKEGLYGPAATSVNSAMGTTNFLIVRLVANLSLTPVIFFALTLGHITVYWAALHAVRRSSHAHLLLRSFFAIEFCRFLFSAGDALGNLKITLTYTALAVALSALYRRPGRIHKNRPHAFAAPPPP